MGRELRVTLEVGPKDRKVVAVAPDWPGLERGAKTGEAAIRTLQSYLPRYAKVAKLAGMDVEFATITNIDVVERYRGTGSTDFWGISFGFSSIDEQPMSSEDLERDLTLMHACWTFFDGVRVRGDAYCTAIRTFHSEGKMARTWPLRYLIRHSAYHTMDHAWEMEDKDLTGAVDIGE